MTDLDLPPFVPFPVAPFRGGRLNHNAAAKAAADKRAAIMGGTIEFVKTLKLDRAGEGTGKESPLPFLVGKIVAASRY